MNKTQQNLSYFGAFVIVSINGIEFTDGSLDNGEKSTHIYVDKQRLQPHTKIMSEIQFSKLKFETIFKKISVDLTDVVSIDNLICKTATKVKRQLKEVMTQNIQW